MMIMRQRYYQGLLPTAFNRLATFDTIGEYIIIETTLMIYFLYHRCISQVKYLRRELSSGPPVFDDN